MDPCRIIVSTEDQFLGMLDLLVVLVGSAAEKDPCRQSHMTSFNNLWSSPVTQWPLARSKGAPGPQNPKHASVSTLPYPALN